MKSKLCIRGFTKVQLVESKTGKIVGDSGWIKNKIQKTGLEQMIASRVGLTGVGGSTPRYVGLGNHTSSINSTNFSAFNTSVGLHTAVNSGTIATTEGAYLQILNTFSGAAHTPAGATISAIGMFNTNTSSSMLAGTTFTGSTWANDQDVRVTYELRFTQT